SSSHAAPPDLASFPTRRSSDLAFYPEIGVQISTYTQVDSRLAYGHVAAPGYYSTTVTRPDLFESYLTEQVKLIMRNHGVPVTIGDRKSTRLNSSHVKISYAVCC